MSNKWYQWFYKNCSYINSVNYGSFMLETYSIVIDFLLVYHKSWSWRYSIHEPQNPPGYWAVVRNCIVYDSDKLNITIYRLYIAMTDGLYRNKSYIQMSFILTKKALKFSKSSNVQIDFLP